MGSTGSGRLSDYSGAREQSRNGQAAGGGSSGVDKCRQAFSTILEEVAQCAYYAAAGTVPPPGTELRIVVAGRIFAVAEGGSTVGALPTSLNYLAGCIESGVQYVGVVTRAIASPVPSVEADFVAADE